MKTVLDEIVEYENEWMFNEVMGYPQTKEHPFEKYSPYKGRFKMSIVQKVEAALEKVDAEVKAEFQKLVAEVEGKAPTVIADAEATVAADAVKVDTAVNTEATAVKTAVATDVANDVKAKIEGA
jgi:hypothetical protein